MHPEQIVEHARDCLEALLRIYYLRHGFRWFDVTCIAFFMQLAILSLELLAKARESPSVPEDEVLARRSTLVLVAKCLYDQGQGGHLPKILYHILYNQLPPDVINDLGRFAGAHVSWKNQLRIAEVRSEYVVSRGAADPNRVGDLVLALRDTSGEASSEDTASP